MDNTGNTVRIFSSQSALVADILEREGVCFSKREYVTKKYHESAPVFTAAYDWFVSEAEKYVPKPKGAEYPYWGFLDLQNVEASVDGRVLRLDAPKDEIIFFDMYDWIKMLRLQYIGADEREEADFRRTLSEYGIKKETDIVLTSFYPELKRQVQDSWKRIFRHHEAVKAGESTLKSVQVSLWQLKKEWLA